MGLFDWISGSFIDVIEWTDDSHDTMVYRFERYGNEIKYGAKLTVRASQVAIFVHEGKIADILEAGMYELETKNLPLLTNLQHWHHGFNSPFKAEVYFVNTKRFTDLKWGTKHPIAVKDSLFSMVRLRAFGNYEIRISDPKTFLLEIVGTDGHFTTDEIEEQLQNLIVSHLPSILAKSQSSILDMAENYQAISSYLSEQMRGYFEAYGLDLTKLFVENISLPPEVAKALDERTSRQITGNLDDHLKYQSAKAVGSEQGAMSEMATMAMAMGMAQSMAQPTTQTAPSSATPPPLPTQIPPYYVAREGKQYGPYGMEEIVQQITQQRLTPEMLVWQEGMSGWKPAREVLSSYFSTTPPPLPPQL